MFLPRVMRPLPRPTRLTEPSVRRIVEAPVSLVQGPQGAYVAEWLAGAIAGWSRWQDCLWLRAPSTQPSALAGSLLRACRYRWAGDGEQAWEPEPASRAQLEAVLRLAPPGAVIVLELEGWVGSGLGVLLEAVRPAVRDQGVSLVAVAQRRLPGVVLRGVDQVASAADLSDPAGARAASGLPAAAVERLAGLAGRRAAVLHDVLDAARAWPVEAVAEAVQASRTGRSLPGRLTAGLLDLCSPGQLAALEVCVATGYWHPQLTTQGAAAAELRPWVVPLERDWGWLRPVWARSLRRQLAGGARRRRPVRATGGTAHAAAAAAPAAEPPAPAPPRGIVEARLLGAFELRVDGQVVGRWAGTRGSSVLRFLLARPRHACSRDELLAEFWSEVTPALARNRLQVAVSGLRRVLQEVTSLNVIEYADGGYRINPQLQVEVDVERFEEARARAGRAERAGDTDGALAAYQEAVGLYGGDFAADAPYEQWALLPRESMRIAYVDILDRVSRIQLGIGRIDDCVATGLRMLAVDPCREDAHRLLMRCYAHQGRTYQALRQYDFCRRVLQATLGTGPTPQTAQLHRAIREGLALSPL